MYEELLCLLHSPLFQWHMSTLSLSLSPHVCVCVHSENCTQRQSFTVTQSYMLPADLAPYPFLPQVTYIFMLFTSLITQNRKGLLGLWCRGCFCRRHISWCFILLELPALLARLWKLNKANTFKKSRGKAFCGVKPGNRPGLSPRACEEISVCRSVSLCFLPAANTYWSC